MLPAISTASQTFATRKRSSPMVEVQSPDHTMRTARSFNGRKTGSIRSLHPHPAILVLVAEREVGGVDQRLAAVVHQEAWTHLVHGVAEGEAGDGIGKAQRAARADMAEGSAAHDHAVAILPKHLG